MYITFALTWELRDLGYISFKKAVPTIEYVHVSIHEIHKLPTNAMQHTNAKQSQLKKIPNGQNFGILVLSDSLHNIPARNGPNA